MINTTNISLWKLILDKRNNGELLCLSLVIVLLLHIRLKAQIPDIQKTLDVVQLLKNTEVYYIILY